MKDDPKQSSEKPKGEDRPKDEKSSPVGRLATVVALAAVVVLAAVVFLGGGDDESDPNAPRIVDAGELVSFSESLSHPVYWLGERPDTAIELTETSTGAIYVRYLTDGAEAGDERGDFVTVGTYPGADPVAELRQTADGGGGAIGRTEGGATLLISPDSAQSAHFAYPGEGVQIEIFSPTPGEALRMATKDAAEAVS